MSPRETYESANGWFDGRLGQAYDLIYSVSHDYPYSDADLLALCDAVEQADVRLLAGEPSL